MEEEKKREMRARSMPVHSVPETQIFFSAQQALPTTWSNRRRKSRPHKKHHTAVLYITVEQLQESGKGKFVDHVWQEVCQHK
jgi:hypothetical protein